MTYKKYFYALAVLATMFIIAVALAGKLFISAKAEEIAVKTSCAYSEGANLLKDSSFENKGTSPFTDAREIADSWKSISWAGTDKNGWGYRDNNNVYMIYSEANLLADETPAIYQDVSVEKNSYYVVSLYAHTFGYTQTQPELYVGYRSPYGNDVFLDIQKHPLDKLGENWEERYAVIYTGNYSLIRLTVQTTSIWVGGELGGYHVDNVRMFKVKTPEAVDFDMPGNFKIGEDIHPVIKVKFSGEQAFSAVQTNAYISTEYINAGGEDIFNFNNQGVLVATATGQANLKLALTIFGKTFESDVKNVTVDESNTNNGVYVKNVSVSTSKTINTAEFANLFASVMLSDDSYLNEGDYEISYATTNPGVVAVRQLNGAYCAIAVGGGSADIVATVKYNGSVNIGKYAVNVKTDNLLIDSGFEAQNDYKYWSSEGTSGTGVDDGTTNIYMHSGISNFWLMSPVWWDASVLPESTARISQVVSLKADKYALSAYIRRYSATGVDGILSGQGGLVTLGAVKLDKNNDETEIKFSKDFDTSYGTGYQYAKLSLVFDVEEEGDYLIYFSVQGDSKYGLGMQLDDFTLKGAKYPVRISASIGADEISVDDINRLYVTAYYEDGTSEQISNGIRAIFEDYHVACESSGFVIGKSGGTTRVKVKVVILDKEYETDLTVKVKGEKVAPPADKLSPTVLALIITGSAVIIIGGGTVAAVILIKNKKRKVNGVEE